RPSTRACRASCWPTPRRSTPRTAAPTTACGWAIGPLRCWSSQSRPRGSRPRARSRLPQIVVLAAVVLTALPLLLDIALVEPPLAVEELRPQGVVFADVL